MIEVLCTFCGNKILRKPYEIPKLKDRPKFFFCGWDCKRKWLRERNQLFQRRLAHFTREVWGTTPLARFNVGDSMKYGRKAEKFAIDTLFPKLGFSEVINFSEKNNQFYIDFVATYKGKRVLIDTTIKLKAWIPKKMKLANALQMPLYILHISPNNDLYYLHKMPSDYTVSRIPSALINKWAQEYDIKKDYR